ncbi:MAG: phytoene/squalene synthase family protein [Bacteroidales bacterium]|nr:phytoene/squalene synthase family protein [Bacteroidales bacterium]
MSLELYNDTCRRCSRLITTRYSTSFSLGIRSLHKSLREPVYSIYGFVRVADEIVDTFHEHDKEGLFREFVADTWKAVEAGISTNPVLHSFQLVVNRYGIDHDLVRAFLRSMEMDLTMSGYSSSEYNEYIYGSAEVVGLMCLKVFCDGQEDEYQKLRPYARRLGAAFQKINFLRDIKSDFDDRGRVYFPQVDFRAFSKSDKKLIEEDISEDFRVALEGIRMLDNKSRFGVYLAYSYYVELFRKIVRAGPEEVTEKRFRVSDMRKIMLLAGAWLRKISGTL